MARTLDLLHLKYQMCKPMTKAIVICSSIFFLVMIISNVILHLIIKNTLLKSHNHKPVTIDTCTHTHTRIVLKHPNYLIIAASKWVENFASSHNLSLNTLIVAAPPHIKYHACFIYLFPAHLLVQILQNRMEDGDVHVELIDMEISSADQTLRSTFSWWVQFFLCNTKLFWEWDFSNLPVLAWPQFSFPSFFLPLLFLEAIVIISTCGAS